jgi:inner membrane protein
VTTPIGHSLAGFIVFLFARLRELRHPLALFLIILAVAFAPDIDYLPILWGDLSTAHAWHQGFTHSLLFTGAAALAAAVAAAAFGISPMLRFLPFALGAAWSHLLLDFLTYDGREPVGILLFWPWGQRFHSPVEVFGGFAKESFAAMVSLHNLYVILREVVILGAVALLLWWVLARGERGAQE